MQEYFSLLDEFFSSIAGYATADRTGHERLAHFISEYPLLSDLFLDSVHDIGPAFSDFWDRNEEQLTADIAERDTLKCLYSGAASPRVLSDMVRKSGLYVDTLLVPDPMLSLKTYFDRSVLDRNTLLRQLVKHAFNISALRDLLTTRFDIPPVVVVPVSIERIAETSDHAVIENGESGFVNYAQLLFGKSFSDVAHALEFFDSFKTPEALITGIVDNGRLPPAVRTLDGLSNHLQHIGHYDSGHFPNSGSVGGKLGWYSLSQHIRVQEHGHYCELLGAEPIYDYELPWFYYHAAHAEIGIDAGIANAIQKDEFQWIQRVPIQAIVELRKDEDLEYMRVLLRRGITDLKVRRDSELISVAAELERSFADAFARQKTDATRLRKKVKKILRKDIPITSAGALIGFVPYLGIPVSLALAGRDIASHIEGRRKAKKELATNEKSVISILMESYDQET